ncbi:cytochrome C-type biogenesis protein CcmH [Pseudomonas aeruginosa]|nr:cytochrome C-type biogenesis protein CcmH [Pseudomonas aeruginosa]
MKRFLATAMLGLALCGVARAAIDTYEFASDAERERFRNLTQELRCRSARTRTSPTPTHRSPPTCASRSTASCSRARATARSSTTWLPATVISFAYKPPVNERTWLLWFGPGALLLFGVLVIGVIVLRRRRTAAKVQTTLSAEEQARLANLLKNDK